MDFVEYLGTIYELKRCDRFDDRMLWFEGDSLCVVDMQNDDTHVAGLIAKWIDREAKKHLTERVRALSSITGWEAHRISFKRQSTIWGSCSSKKHLSLNMNLISLDPDIIDYVIIHELAHTVELNHSRAFWSLVHIHCPNYPILKARLRDYERKTLTKRGK